VDFDIVMCNMISSIFLPFAGELRSLLTPAGVAVFSGLLASEVESVSGALRGAGFEILSGRVLGEWASLITVGTTVT
jgi:ribosomal protein L11 methylase PrmA